MNVNPVNWFEVPVTDLDRAMKFYEATLQVEIKLTPMGDAMMGWFPMDMAATGSTGALVKSEHSVPSMVGTLVFFSTSDVTSALERAVAAGGEVILPRTSIGEYGVIGQIRDSEGNRVGLHSVS